MKKNEVINFAKQYRSTICLNEKLEFIKVVEAVEQDNIMYFRVVGNGGEDSVLPADHKVIPLKGRLKDRDYNYIEAQFNKTLCQI